MNTIWIYSRSHFLHTRSTLEVQVPHNDFSHLVQLPTVRFFLQWAFTWQYFFRSLLWSLFSSFPWFSLWFSEEYFSKVIAFLINTNGFNTFNINIICLFSALLVLCILSGIVGVAYLGFNPLVRSLVLKRLVLSNTSDTFHIWEDPPISPHFKVST